MSIPTISFFDKNLETNSRETSHNHEEKNVNILRNQEQEKEESVNIPGHQE